MEPCALHPQMREDISKIFNELGEVKGRQEMQLSALGEIKNGITELTRNGNVQKQEQAILKTKLSPLFWGLMIVASVLLTGVTSFIINHFWRIK
jgi:hypothetical protein